MNDDNLSESDITENDNETKELLKLNEEVCNAKDIKRKKKKKKRRVGHKQSNDAQARNSGAEVEVSAIINFR